MNEVLLRIALIGKRKLIVDLAESKAALRGIRYETRMVGDTMVTTTKRTFLMNQALFTLRRLTYGLTLGFIAFGAVALKWGFEFNSQVNQAQVGFKGFIQGTDAINREISQIYLLAAKTPFNFPDILLATRRLVPYNSNLQEVNSTVESLSNTLAAQGIANNRYLTAATIQFAHIYALGRVTGQQVNALARDNIPLIQFLANYYGTTTANVKELIHEGLVPAGDATKALIQAQNQAGYAGKNFALATQTLSGAWATFQDIMRYAFGRGERGIFEGARRTFQNIAKDMLPLIEGNRPITVYMIAEAFDKALSPKTHVIIYLFTLFQGILQGIVGTFYVFFKVLDLVLTPFAFFESKTRAGRQAMHIFGIALGISISLLIIYRGLMLFTALAVVIATVAQFLYNNVLLSYTGIAIGAGSASIFLSFAILGIVGATILLVGTLVVLYFKWKAFHDLVNTTAKFLYDHWYLLAFIPIFGPMVALIVTVIHYWDRLRKGIETTYKMLVKFKNAVTGPAKFLWGGAKFAGRVATGRQGLQHGGFVTNPGAFTVGEMGPELVNLPRGSAVTPMAAGGFGGAFSLTIEPAPVIIDGRQITEVVFKHRLDRQARR